MTIFAIILGLSSFLAGISKIGGAQDMQDVFDEFGLGRQGLLGVGALEVAAAVGLQIDVLEIWAALGLALLMAGAIWFHQRADHGPGRVAPAALTLGAAGAFLLLSF